MRDAFWIRVHEVVFGAQLSVVVLNLVIGSYYIRRVRKTALIHANLRIILVGQGSLSKPNTWLGGPRELSEANLPNLVQSRRPILCPRSRASRSIPQRVVRQQTTCGDEHPLLVLQVLLRPRRRRDCTFHFADSVGALRCDASHQELRA